MGLPGPGFASQESPVRLFGPIHVSVGPVYVSIQSGRCEHRLAARLADRAPYQGFMWFLAVIRPIRWANGVQGVAGGASSRSNFVDLGVGDPWPVLGLASCRLSCRLKPADHGIGESGKRQIARSI